MGVVPVVKTKDPDGNYTLHVDGYFYKDGPFANLATEKEGSTCWFNSYTFFDTPSVKGDKQLCKKRPLPHNKWNFGCKLPLNTIKNSIKVKFSLSCVIDPDRITEIASKSMTPRAK